MVWRKWIVLMALALGASAAAQARVIDYGSASGWSNQHPSGDGGGGGGAGQGWYGQGNAGHDWGYDGGHGAPSGAPSIGPVIVAPSSPSGSTDPTSPVPEPASALMLVAGLALVGAALARRSARG